MSTGKWYQQQEKGASNLGLNALFLVYKIFGLRFLKFWVQLVAIMIGASAKSAKRFSQEYLSILNEYQIAHNMKPTKFSTARHISAFADSLVDKMIAMCSEKNQITFTSENNTDWYELQNLLKQKHGVFLICSHIGNIEALAAFPDNKKFKIHAFQQISQTTIFHKFISRHAIRKNTIIHPVENMNMATASEMFDSLNNGELVMMAGDRISATNPDKTIHTEILGQCCKLPIGVFKFAKAMSHPVFAIALLNIGNEKYKLIVQKLDETNTHNMANDFAKFLEKIILIAPIQWFNFYNFFK